MKGIYFILAAVMISCSFARGQVTPAPADVDTVKTDTTELISEQGEDQVKETSAFSDRYIPRRASLYAAILPGAGQVYNKAYWKLPLVYGGFVALGLAVDFYNDQYRILRRDLFRVLDDQGFTSPYGNEQQLRNSLSRARRERDFYIIMIGALYFLQIADAHIGAHLKEFKLNPNLQVSLEPTIESSEFLGSSAGLALKLKF